jgi:hypothetical protein
MRCNERSLGGGRSLHDVLGGSQVTHHHYRQAHQLQVMDAEQFSDRQRRFGVALTAPQRAGPRRNVIRLPRTYPS